MLTHFPSKVFDPSKVSCLSRLLFCFVPKLALIDQNMALIKHDNWIDLMRAMS